jgi:phage-related protein
MNAGTNAVAKRFFQASLGWIRYKPLLIYITNRGNYKTEIRKIKENLTKVISSVCSYFGNDKFKDILNELDFFDAHVEEHYADFGNTKNAWIKIVKFLEDRVSSE